MQAELGGLAPDVAARALARPGQAVWGDPTCHELSRAAPRHARRLIAINDPIAQEKRRAASRAALPTSGSAPQEAGGRPLSEP